MDHTIYSSKEVIQQQGFQVNYLRYTSALTTLVVEDNQYEKQKIREEPNQEESIFKEFIKERLYK